MIFTKSSRSHPNDHQIRGLDHDAQRRLLPRRQVTRCLLDHFKRERPMAGSGPLHAGLPRFTFDKFHRIKVFAIARRNG